MVKKIEYLNGLSPQVQKVAESFAEVSNLFKAVDTHKLPAFLPAEEPPKLQVYQVDQKVLNQKKTKS